MNHLKKKKTIIMHIELQGLVFLQHYKGGPVLETNLDIMQNSFLYLVL
jgi:hypothetical protein